MVLMSESWLKENLMEHTFVRSEPGINVEYFIKNCPFLQSSLPQINRRILIAAGKNN